MDVFQTERDFYNTFSCSKFPNYYGSYEDNLYGYIALEYIEAGNLKNSIKGPLNVDTVQMIAYKMAQCI